MPSFIKVGILCSRIVEILSHLLVVTPKQMLDILRKTDLVDRLSKTYDIIEETENALVGAEAKKRTVVRMSNKTVK